MKSKINSKRIKITGSIIFITLIALTICFSVSMPVNATSVKSNEQSVSQIDQTPMYSDPKYTNKDLNTNSTINDQNKAYAPPPKSPDQGNQITDTPVSSSILPLLAMALGLVLWKIHYQLKKVKK